METLHEFSFRFLFPSSAPTVPLPTASVHNHKHLTPPSPPTPPPPLHTHTHRMAKKKTRPRKTKLKVINPFGNSSPAKKEVAPGVPSTPTTRADLVAWTGVQLRDLLGFDADDLAEYILEFEDKDAITTYLADLLQVEPSQKRIVSFADSLLSRSSHVSAFSSDSTTTPNPTTTTPNSTTPNPTPSSSSNPAPSSSTPTPDQLSLQSKNAASSKFSRKKGTIRGGIELLRSLPEHLRTASGACDCQASVHELLGNCLNCGKIICSLEGWGPCTFCETPLGSKTQIKRDKGKVRARHARASREREEALEKAKERKNRLLRQEREYAKRNKVIDDQADYFQTSNMWLSQEERAAVTKRAEKVEAAKAQSRDRANMRTTISFDLAGRRVLIAEGDRHTLSLGMDDDEGESSQSPSIAPVQSMAPSASRPGVMGYSGIYRNPSLETTAPMFVVPDYRDALAAAAAEADQKANLSRKARNLVLQHDDYFPAPDPNVAAILAPPAPITDASEDALIQSANSPFARDPSVVDKGMCLSMHQPWASLLVAGIKKVEGRTWKSDFRGPLWIAATVREPSDEEIAAVEAQYAAVDPDLTFPESYPTAALLGRVNVDTVLSHEEYVASAPDDQREDNESPYVFVVSSPTSLVVPFAVSGSHKIWKLPTSTHAAAQANIAAQL